MQLKIAIVLLNNYGDILYATPISKQIKENDYPGSNLTWIVSQPYSAILKNNPYIDTLEIIDYQMFSTVYRNKFDLVKKDYKNKHKEGLYDKLFILQPKGEVFLRYKTCLRNMILGEYIHPVKVSLKPLVFLTPQEESNVERFIEANDIMKFTHRLLFEFSPGSGQSNISPAQATAIAESIIKQNESVCIILSSHKELANLNKNIFNAQSLTFNENASLINYCTLLVGSSSGITWLSTSQHCKRIPTIQFVKPNVQFFNSLVYDFTVNNINTSHVLEVYNYTIKSMTEIINHYLNNGFEKTKLKYQQPLKRKYLYNNYYQVAKQYLLNRYYWYALLFFFKNLHKGPSFILGNIRFFLLDVVRSVKKI